MVLHLALCVSFPLTQVYDFHPTVVRRRLPLLLQRKQMLFKVNFAPVVDGEEGGKSFVTDSQLIAVRLSQLMQ